MGTNKNSKEKMKKIRIEKEEELSWKLLKVRIIEDLSEQEIDKKSNNKNKRGD